MGYSEHQTWKIGAQYLSVNLATEAFIACDNFCHTLLHNNICKLLQGDDHAWPWQYQNKAAEDNSFMELCKAYNILSKF
jgi:hypothetical protein